MKKLTALLLSLAMLLCAATALAEDGDIAQGTDIRCDIEDGSYVIRIADENGDLGWLADDMSQDASVVTLAGEGLEGGEYVVRYAPVADGEATVAVRHYIGIACDEMHTFDLVVKDGAVQESTGGSYTASPDEAEQDPYLSGQWLEAGDGFARMTIAKGEGRGWDVEIRADSETDDFRFVTTVYYDCDKDSFVYDKGKFWDEPGDAADLGEASAAGTCGDLAFSGDEGDLRLTWYDDRYPDREVGFKPLCAIDYGASELYDQADMDEAIALIKAEIGSWEGVELHSVRYFGDECMNDENLAYVNSLGAGKDYVQMIEFLTDFHSPVEGGGAWEPDSEYTDYQWWLAREADGGWELVTWGY